MRLLERVRRDPARAVRQGLLGLVVLVSAATAWSLLRPKPGVEPAASPPPSGTGTTVGELTFLRFKDESRRIEVKAKEMVGSQESGTMILHGVEATLPYVREGRAGTVTITADECQYQQAVERAAFKGNVVLRTDDGFELESASLKYWGDKERAFSADPIHFKRGSVDGTALGFEYRAGQGVELRGDVRIKVTPPAGGEETHITSPSATASREERRITFHDGAVARQGARELRGKELRLALNEGLDRIERAVVTGNADLTAGPGTSLTTPATGVAPAAAPGAAPPAGRSERLRSQKLEVDFGPAGELKQALATGAATLDVEPGPSEPKERRHLSGPRLRFDFDAEGRLASVHGPRAGARPGPKDRPVLTADPLEAAEGALARRVESDGFDATLDPATGALLRAEFEGTVAFSEPGRKAFAGHAVHDVAAGTIVLTREPRIVDEAEGSELRGREIRIGTRTRAVSASGSVRHEVRGKGRRAGLFGAPAGGSAQPAAKPQEPTVIVCREFEYDPQAKSARYRENALMRSGEDEVRAPLITLDEAAQGQRRMTATGGVTSVLHPQAAKGSAKEPAAVETRSKEMVYEEAKSHVVYSGDVEIRQGDILTKSPEAVVLLSKDGESVDKLLAGEPVEVHQGIKRANGERGTYTPANETFVLVGEKVVLHDADRRLEGRMLTFEVGSDRIRVDGREEVRTEAVFRRKELQRP